MIRRALIRGLLRVHDWRQRLKFEKRFGGAAPYAYGGYDTLEFEKRRLALMEGLLSGRRYERALEVGCAEGAFTQRLAPLCGGLEAIDVSAAALARARERVPGGRVRFVETDLRSWRPDGPLDLAVLSEVLYYLGERNELLRLLGVTPEDCVEEVCRRLVEALTPGGRILLAHSYGKGDRPKRELFRDVFKRLGLAVSAEKDVEPTGEPGTDFCLVSLLEKQP